MEADLALNLTLRERSGPMAAGTVLAEGAPEVTASFSELTNRDSGP